VPYTTEYIEISRFFFRILGFEGIWVIFGSVSGIFGFFLVVWQKVAEFGHPSSTGIIGYFEYF
jgi:hypothetical protein